jgi:hypothetical protein
VRDINVAKVARASGAKTFCHSATAAVLLAGHISGGAQKNETAALSKAQRENRSLLGTHSKTPPASGQKVALRELISRRAHSILWAPQEQTRRQTK